MAGEFSEFMQSAKKDAIGFGIIIALVLVIALFAYIVSLF